MGRRPKLTPNQQSEVRAALARGENPVELAKRYGVTPPTIRRLRADVPPPAGGPPGGASGDPPAAPAPAPDPADDRTKPRPADEPEPPPEVLEEVAFGAPPPPPAPPAEPEKDYTELVLSTYALVKSTVVSFAVERYDPDLSAAEVEKLSRPSPLAEHALRAGAERIGPVLARYLDSLVPVIAAVSLDLLMAIRHIKTAAEKREKKSRGKEPDIDESAPEDNAPRGTPGPTVLEAPPAS